jgi:superfamily I DNA/RNA helicase
MLVAVYKNLRLTSLESFTKGVQDLFADEADRVVWLSSIHRAKGNEAERVFIVRPDLLSHPMARTPVQVEQEQNVCYVAYTRANEALYFVGGPAPKEAA